MVQRALLALALAAAASVAAAQAPLEQLLTGEPTPGTVALLVHHVARPETHRRLAEALRHPRPEVRAAAGRVIHVIGAKGFVPDLAAALAVERAADPALELGRALAALGGPGHDAVVAASWARVPSGHAGRVAVPFAALRGIAALDALPQMRDASDGAPLAAYLIAARPDAAALDRIVASALTDRDSRVFGAAFEAARELALAIDDRHLLSGLAPAQDPPLRLAAALEVFRRWRPGAEPSPALQAALAADGPFSERIETVDAELVRVFASRVTGRPVMLPPDWRALFEQPSPRVVGVVRLPGVDRLLTADERKWLRKSLPNRRDGATPDASAPPAATGPVVALLDDFPEGYVLDVMRATGCDLGRARQTGFGAGAGQLTLHADGRVSRISRIDTGVAQAACALATEVLLMTSVAPVRPAAAGAQTIAVLPFDPGYLECRDRQAQDVVAVGLRDGSRFDAPKKIKHVNPTYPTTAQDARVQGTVVIRSTVGTQGCPSHLQVVASVDPRLDLSALLAVSGWRFAPTRIDGTPVPVEMTVTVSFSLR